MCEKIHDNLTNKNIILIDESVKSGNTINAAIEYLLSKNVNMIYLTTIINDQNNQKIINNYKINSIIYSSINLIWPWGYDN